MNVVFSNRLRPKVPTGRGGRVHLLLCQPFSPGTEIGCGDSRAFDVRPRLACVFSSSRVLSLGLMMSAFPVLQFAGQDGRFLGPCNHVVQVAPLLPMFLLLLPLLPFLVGCTYCILQMRRPVSDLRTTQTAVLVTAKRILQGGELHLCITIDSLPRPAPIYIYIRTRPGSSRLLSLLRAY